MKTKNLTTQRQLVTDLLEEYCHQNGLYDYKLVFDRRLTRLGACTWRHMKGFPDKWNITFNFSDKFLMVLDDKDIEDTVRHEVAHAITPADERPHGAVWKANDIRMGGSGERCYDSSVEQKEELSKYRGVCPNGHTRYRMRLTRNAKTESCGKCSSVYDPQYRYTYTQLR